MAGRKAAIVAAGLAVFALGTYVGMKYRQKGVAPSPQTGSQYDQIASKFDSAVDLDESLFGITKLRRQLVRNAKGRVLEIAAGTGRNIGFYQAADVSSLMLVDLSEKMIALARQKKPSLPLENVAFGIQDARRLDFPSGSFDSVVDTYGLCSVDSPEAVLREMQRVCKPGGEILLLEHGRGSWRLVNYYLNRRAESHKAHWGCEWNKDIAAIVEASGLEIVEQRRSLFGTNHYYRARPRPLATT